MAAMALQDGAYRRVETLGRLNRALTPDEWPRLQRCPCCESGRLARFATIRSLPYERCRNCGFTFANPPPSDDVLAEFYNSPFYANYRSLEADRLATDRYFSVSFSNLSQLAAWIDLDRSARILDFGCGPGSLIALLRDVHDYRNVEGLEISAAGRALARQEHGLHVAPDIRALRCRYYDLVLLVEVIEHVPSPDLFLDELSGLLAPGGRIFITTDSVRNVVSRFFPAHSAHYTGPSHISLFTERAIRALLSRAGFVIERLEAEPSAAVLGDWIASPFYHLDFLSPTSDSDPSDLIYIPNRLGRLMKLGPTRRLPNPLRAAKRMDRLAARALNRMLSHHGSEHLFVLARRNAS